MTQEDYNSLKLHQLERSEENKIAISSDSARQETKEAAGFTNIFSKFVSGIFGQSQADKAENIAVTEDKT